MKRLKKIAERLQEFACDSLLVTKPENVSYLTNFSGDSSHLLLTKDASILFTDGRYLEQARQECHKEIEIYNWIDSKRYDPKSYEFALGKLNANRLAFESLHLAFADFKRLQEGLHNVTLIPSEGLIEEIRMIKYPQEIAFLREACQISDKALQMILPEIKPGIPEVSLTALLEYQLRILGGDGISFKTIVLSGKKTSLLHGHPGDKRLQKGEFLLFDFGALYKGYHADISRTFVVGEASSKQKFLYSIIQEAQMKAVQSIRAGVEGNTPDKLVRDTIPPEFIQYYYPGMGHGVGLEIHELPFIRQEARFSFEPGMVLTVEPGLYIPGWGGLRIEDTLLVTEEGPELLTHFPRELMEIK